MVKLVPIILNHNYNNLGSIIGKIEFKKEIRKPYSLEPGYIIKKSHVDDNNNIIIDDAEILEYSIMDIDEEEQDYIKKETI